MLEYFIACMGSELYSKWGSVKNKLALILGLASELGFFREGIVSG